MASRHNFVFSDVLVLVPSVYLQVAPGRQWYGHVVYTIHPRTGRKRHTKSESDHHAIIQSNTKNEHIGWQNMRGSNLQPISIQGVASASHVPIGAASGLEMDSLINEESLGNQSKDLMFQAAMVLLTITGFLTGVTLSVCVSRKRKTQSMCQHTHSLLDHTLIPVIPEEDRERENVLETLKSDG